MKSHLLRCSLISVIISSCSFNNSTNVEATKDSSVAIADADPNAPDADPNAPDADPSAPDADPSVPDAAPNAPDAKPGVVGVACGGSLCNSSQECCSDFQAQSSTCVALDSCPDFASKCDGPEDCPGQVCCGDFGGTTCAASCGMSEGELCAVDDDCSQSGDSCCKLEFAGTSICQAQCGGGGGGGFP